MDVLTIVLSFFLILIGFGLGATLSYDDLRAAGKARGAFLCGMLSQFIIMPLLSFGLARAFDLEDDVALGLILVGSCPGGATSNLFTYWSRGNVALSVAMSAASQVVAFGMMPLNVFLYGKLAYGMSANVPYASLIISLLVMLVPFSLGVYSRHRNSEGKWRGKFYWQWIEVCGSVTGMLFLAAAVIYATIVNVDVFRETSAGTFVSTAVLEPVATALGFALASVIKLPMMDRCTVALETGIQNSSLATAIAALSFDGDRQDRVIRVPLLYGFFYVLNGPWIVALFRYLNRQSRENQEQASSDADKSSEANEPRIEKTLDLDGVKVDVIMETDTQEA